MEALSSHVSIAPMAILQWWDDFSTGNQSLIEINLLLFSKENHTLTVNFTDERGGDGNFQYFFIGIRDGKGTYTNVS